MHVRARSAKWLSGAIAAWTVLRTFADVYTYPVKSVNLASAYTPSFYVALEGSQLAPVTDLHPVHGIQTSDGGYVLTGKGVEQDGSSIKEAWAVKLNSAGGFVWAWRSNITGDDAANAVVQLPGNGDLLIAGWRKLGSVGHRSLTKLAHASGVEIWTGTFGDSASSNGAWEMICLTSDGVVLAGLHQKPSTSEMSFKSYGNVAEGQAVVMKLPLFAVTSGTPPTAGHASWVQTFAGFLTSKAARPVTNAANSNIVVLLYAEVKEKHATLQMLNSTGSTVWGPTDYASTQYEGTDVQASADGASVIVTGQGGTPNTYSAKLTKVQAVDGTRLWTKTYTAGGTPELIFNECWGAVVTVDSYVVACGTGIENCAGTRNTADCANGIGDNRTGALPRNAGVWQSLVIRTDTDGNLLWQRVDSYKHPSFPALASSMPAHRTSSAAEWVVATSDGGLAVFLDEVNGMGVMKLMPSPTDVGNSSQKCTQITRELAAKLSAAGHHPVLCANSP